MSRFLVDDKLSHSVELFHLLNKLRALLGFYYRNENCLAVAARKSQCKPSFSTLDYCLDTVYQRALCFITNSSCRTCHFAMFLGSRGLRRQHHWNILFIYQAILNKLPSYLCNLLSLAHSMYSSSSSIRNLYKVPRIPTELGRAAFFSADPWSWNHIHNSLQLAGFISMGESKACARCTCCSQC